MIDQILKGTEMNAEMVIFIFRTLAALIVNYSKNRKIIYVAGENKLP